MKRLAVLVPQIEAEGAIDALRSEGVYDASRSVVEGDDGTLELPVTAPPDETAVLDVVQQVDPVGRTRGLEERLRARGWTPDDLEAAPSSWSVVGDVVLVRFPDNCPDPEAVGEALLDLHGAETVLAKGDIVGPTREPEVSVVAGSGETSTVHVEHGVRFALDLREVMFSPGNQAERVRMAELVESGERVLDAFAGIGYFALPMAVEGADVTAIEIDPTAFRYLIENAVLNEVESRLTATLGDCREVVGDDGPGAASTSVADRLVLGHFDAVDHLDALLPAVAPGGTVHLHDAVPTAAADSDTPRAALEAAADAAERTVEVLGHRVVKSYAPGVDHVVLDARVE